jgi:cytochrome c peroxidase
MRDYAASMPVRSRCFTIGLLGCLILVSSICRRAEAAACSDVFINPAEVQVGDRLFRETRFAAFFFFNDNGNVNSKLPKGGGEPEIAQETNAAGKPIPDPFRGLSMNCRNCHLGNDLLHVSKQEGRTYCDFARRSPILDRQDGHLTSPRNAQELVSVSRPRGVPNVFHFDGEFASIEDLTIGTLTGRNLGWLAGESAAAVKHIANVIRNDDGHNALAARYGCGGFPYKVVLLGTDPRLPKNLRLPNQYRIDVTTATDAQILNDIGLLIHAYMDSIAFDLSEPPSPYDIFLKKNNLPTAPNPGESNAAYTQRLFGLVQQLSSPVFVTPRDGKLQLHKPQKFQFGAAELQGLKIFFTQPASSNQPHAGNCVACHVPPVFTDNIFHNTGASQIEYDGVFGAGSFAALSVPDLNTRNSNFDAYLPPSANHPNASGMFRSPPSQNKPGFTDLGVWNIFANPDIPNPQSALTTILCGEFNLSSSNCTPDAVLPRAISFFKTPSIKDPGQSSPYLHNGSLDTIESVLNFYATVSQMARGGQLRNSSPELSNVFIDQTDVAPLSAFLNSLNEDYH